jgi:hypothetical protein
MGLDGNFKLVREGGSHHWFFNQIGYTLTQEGKKGLRYGGKASYWR